MTRGWWNMHCWNALSLAQQQRLVSHGNLPLGYHAEGECQNPATCEITTEDDSAPGPRFYCYPCAIEYLTFRNEGGIGPEEGG